MGARRRSAIRPACGMSSGMSKWAMGRGVLCPPVSAAAILIIAAVLLLFALFNVTAYRALTRIHPRRRRMVRALLILGNAMWLFFPILNARTPFSRLARAVLG